MQRKQWQAGVENVVGGDVVGDGAMWVRRLC